MGVQVDVGRIRSECPAALVNRAVYGGEILFDDPHGFRVEVRPARLERALEICNRFVVLRIGKVGGRDCRTVCRLKFRRSTKLGLLRSFT